MNQPIEEQKPYILHIASWFPTKVDAFDGDFIKRQIDLVARDQDVVIHAQKDPQLPLWKIQLVREEKAFVGYYNNGVFLLNPLFQFVVYIRLWTLLKNEKSLPQLVHVHALLYGAMLAFLLFKKYCIPYVITMHSSFFLQKATRWRDRIKLKFSQWISSYATYLIPVSEPLRESLRGLHFIPRKEVIYNVVPDIFFQIKKTNQSEKPFSFIHISTLDDKVKNVTGILLAFKALVESGIEAKMSFVASEAENIEWFAKLVNNHPGLSKYVTIKGTLSHEEVAGELASHHAMVHFSYHETFGLVLAEAWAAGIPVVCSRFGGLSDQINGPLGILVNQDVPSLTHGMKKIVEDYDGFDSKAIRKFAFQRFHRDEIKKSYQTIYRNVVGEEFTF